MSFSSGIKGYWQLLLCVCSLLEKSRAAAQHNGLYRPEQQRNGGTAGVPRTAAGEDGECETSLTGFV